MGDGEAVQVAVRVRPFNDREKARKATLVIEMPDAYKTIIRDPSNMKAEPKRFEFDHSYWSHDGFTERSDGYLETASSKYADQMKVFSDLGVGVLDNAWKGYNCSLFAYGQTGSGKSYSMVGWGTNKGIVPIACEELFKRIEAKKGQDKIEYQVSISMFEIYCEKVRDLLTDKAGPKGGLKVREHPKKGFYVEGLRSAPVNSYKQIDSKIDEGTRNRTLAATNMNATSSRAHTIVQIQFAQKGEKNANGEHTTKTSLINLVDLAGSERQADAGTAGDRLKEGIVINQSLSTLGRCIKALHEQQNAKGKAKNTIQVPYRDSVLTSLLKNALGGNSKTVMIAALSPADINYDETLSTLRFADRAKSIKTRAIVNESATDRMIRELKEENARLAEMMKNGGVAPGTTGGSSNEELEALRLQLEQNQREMQSMEQTWQQRLANEALKHGTADGRAEIDERRSKQPHFWNLNEDPALTNMVVHFIDLGDVRVGNNQGAHSAADIQLSGLSIQKEHALIVNKDNKKIKLTPMRGAEILVNGKMITKETELQHNDRVLFGGNHLYVFSHPVNMAKQQKKGKLQEITFDIAQQEIAQNSGLTSTLQRGADSNKSKAEMILEEELINLLPQVYRANAMSEELSRGVKFEIVLVAPQARGLKDGQTEVWVKLYNRNEDTEFLWERNTFINRYYGMQELYQNYIEGYADWDVPKERDPFYESPESEVLIGSVNVYLQSLAYMVEFEEQLPITDFTGQERGQLSVSLAPCTPQGKEITGEFVDSPRELVGKNLNFKVKLMSAIGLPRQFTKSRCKYKFYDQKETQTIEIAGSSPTYGHEKTFTFKPVSKELANYLKENALYITVWGTQSSRGDPNRRRSIPKYNTNGGVESEAVLEEKLRRVERLLNEAMTADSKNLSVRAIKKALGEEANGSKKPSSELKKIRDTAGAKKASSRSSSKKREPSKSANSKSSADSGIGKELKSKEGSVKKRSTKPKKTD